MSRISKSGRMIPSNRLALRRPRNQAGRLERPPSSGRCTPRLEQLEDRITPATAPFASAPLQLQGDVFSATAHDWNQVWLDAGSPNTVGASGQFDSTHNQNSAAVAGGFTVDAVNKTTDFGFTGGGSKDIYDITKWLYTNNKPQAKDDLNHAMAACYNVVQPDGSTHLILYAALDRFDGSGDSTAGFWILQDPTVGTTTTNPLSSGSPFTGKHMDGDVLVVSDFTNGGGTSTP